MPWVAGRPRVDSRPLSTVAQKSAKRLGFPLATAFPAAISSALESTISRRKPARYGYWVRNVEEKTSPGVSTVEEGRGRQLTACLSLGPIRSTSPSGTPAGS